jgi:hypothetical protein
MPSDGKSSHCLWQGELTRVIFLFTEDILEINQYETRIACGGHVC